MQRYAIIKNGVVQNITKATEEFAAKRNWVACDNTVEKEYTYDGAIFSPPDTDTPNEGKKKALKEAIFKALRQTDWTQLVDFPDGQLKTDWATYRQELRTALQTPNLKPKNFTWPTPPGEVDES